MADNRINIPSGIGGLTRYFDDYTTKIMLKPEYVIALIILVVLYEIIVRFI